MKKHFFILVVISLFLSCSKESGTKQQTNSLEETPEVLDENMTDIGFSSYDKRMKKDIIQQLFDEAVRKDEQLRSINSRITEMSNIKNDSLKDFETYIRNNQNYWASLKMYANQLNDTTLKVELENFTEILESKYINKISPLNSVAKQIGENEKSLRDQEILMKIFVTAPMMSAYQHNEFPDISTLKSLKSSLDTLINDVKTYSKIRK